MFSLLYQDHSTLSEDKEIIKFFEMDYQELKKNNPYLHDTKPVKILKTVYSNKQAEGIEKFSEHDLEEAWFQITCEVKGVNAQKNGKEKMIAVFERRACDTNDYLDWKLVI